HSPSLVAFRAWPQLSRFAEIGRGLPWCQSFPSVHQRGRDVTWLFATICRLRLYNAPPSLPTASANLAGTPMNFLAKLVVYKLDRVARQTAPGGSTPPPQAPLPDPERGVGGCGFAMELQESNSSSARPLSRQQ